MLGNPGRFFISLVRGGRAGRQSMTLQTEVDLHASPMAAIQGAWDLYTIATGVFAELLREVKAERKDNTRELGAYTKDIRDTLKLFLQERAAIDKLRKDYGGLGSGPGERSLDLDAARDEIGRRLSLLRDARGD